MIAEFVDSRSQAVDDQALTRAASAGGDGWTADDLLDAVDRLCLVYSLPLLARAQGTIVAEARAFEAMGIASTAYLASAVACAIRVTSFGPAVAFGRWSGSVILSHLLATIPAVPVEPELFLGAPPGPPDLSPEWSLQPPLFLIADDPESNLLRLLGDDPLLSDARIMDSTGAFELRAAVGIPPCPTSLGSAGVPTGASPAGTVTVALRSSRLLWVLREALSLVERETGAIVRLGEDDATWPVSSSVPQADWFVDLPEIPAWAAMASAYGATAPDTVSLWLSLAPSPPSLSAAAALRTRAYLAHALVAMASQWSTLDWSAHLWTAPKPSVGADPTAALPVDFANGGESAIGEVTARGEPSAGPGTSVPSRETLILKQGGTTPWMEPGSVVGDRQWRQDDVLLTVLAMDLSGSRAHTIVRDFPVRRSEDEDSTTLVVTRPAESLAPVWVEAALVAPKRAVVEILVPLLGDKDRDLDRLARVRAVLGDYKGEAQVRLVLTRGNFRRVLDGEDGYGIAWSGSFVDALELLLGIGCARLIE